MGQKIRGSDRLLVRRINDSPTKPDWDKRSKIKNVDWDETWKSKKNVDWKNRRIKKYRLGKNVEKKKRRLEISSNVKKC